MQMVVRLSRPAVAAARAEAAVAAAAGRAEEAASVTAVVVVEALAVAADVSLLAQQVARATRRPALQRTLRLMAAAE
jgi:hypothetical protein